MTSVKHIIFQSLTTKDQKEAVVGRYEVNLPFVITKDMYIDQSYYPKEGDYKVQSSTVVFGPNGEFSHIDIDMEILIVDTVEDIADSKEAFENNKWRVLYCSLDKK